MNALEAASLVMIPSGYEDGTLGSLKPTDGTGDFTFSRGSNISATRVNADGNIEKGYENLLLQSNSFDTTWGGAGFNFTPNQGGYDGSNDAWLMTSTATGYAACRLTQGVSFSGVSTLSVYAKGGSVDSFGLRTNEGTTITWFELTGVGNASSNGVIEPLDNDWYRCSVYVTGSHSSYRIYIGSTFSNYNVAAGDSIYIQDAMLNQGLVAYPYVETTTAPVAGGILEDMPRLDYSNGSCPSLLLEPSRTNRCTFSEYFQGAAWLSIGGPTITTNYGISPEGVKNSTRIQFSGTNQCIYDGISYTSEEVSTIYVKGTSGETIKFGKGDNIFVGDIFTLDGTWQRLKFVQSVSGNTFTINTSGGATARDIEIWGAQNEEGSYPTSYIPTYGVSQTRLEDFCEGAGNASTFNSSGGVLFFEGSALFDDETRRHISVSDGTTANRLTLRYDTISNNIQAFVQAGGLIYGNLRTSNYTITDNLKMAYKWESGNQKLYVNGQIVDSSTDVFTFNQNILNDFSFTRGGSSTSQIFYGNTKQVAYFPTALSDEACIELTTI